MTTTFNDIISKKPIETLNNQDFHRLYNHLTLGIMSGLYGT